MLPLRIDDWRGRTEPELSPEILRVLGVDDYILRTYGTPKFGSLGLYAGYYRSQRQGDSIHSPLNCLPGAGWVPVEQGHLQLSVQEGTSGAPRLIEVNRVVIQRGLDRSLVLYWYQSHGRVVASEYWGKIYTVVDAIHLNRTDAALVRVIVPIRQEGREAVITAEQAGSAFVRAVFPKLGSYLPY